MYSKIILIIIFIEKVIYALVRKNKHSIKKVKIIHKSTSFKKYNVNI